MTATPPTPAVAAVLWRERAGALELFLGQRAPSVAFFGGFWSIPGGAVDAVDHRATVAGADGDRAAQIAACAREVAEEVGVVLPLVADRYVEAGRWVTPALSPIRFDATYFLVAAPDDAAPDVRAGDGELVDGAWVTPADAIARWSTGAWLIPYPVVRVLRALAPGIDGAAARCAAEAVEEARSPRIWELAPGIALSPVRTPTLPPATHTNCYVIGTERCVVIDPASPYPEERAALDEALDCWAARGRRVHEIWLTHHHPDHVGGVAHLAARLRVPVAAHRVTAELVAPAIRVDRLIEDGDAIDLPGAPARRLRAVFTPGHAPGHLCFVEETTGMIVAGDMVATVGTIVVDPDEGDMRQYLASLERLDALAPRALLPAHGHAIADARGKLRAYVEHRLWRERRVYDALAARAPATARDLVAPVYADVPKALYPLAERSLLAHLIKLADDGRVRRDGDRWML